MGLFFVTIEIGYLCSTQAGDVQFLIFIQVFTFVSYCSRTSLSRISLLVTVFGISEIFSIKHVQVFVLQGKV